MFFFPKEKKTGKAETIDGISSNWVKVEVQADETYEGMNNYYLSGHLSRDKEFYHEGDTVLPGKIAGYVGNTGHCGTSLVSIYNVLVL